MMTRDTELEEDLRLTHWYIIGASRSGKTTFLTNVLITDCLLNHGLCYIDFHGDTARDLPLYIPKNRIKDVIYFDPVFLHNPAFNLLKLKYEPSKLADDITDIFEGLAKGSWGSRLEDILSNTLLATIYDMRDNGTQRTLLDVKKFILQESFRKELLSRAQLEELNEFWDWEFPELAKGSTNPVTNKLNKLLRPGTTIRGIFTEPENEIDFRDIMDNRKILIVRLAKGAIGERTARTLGNIFIKSFEQAAFSREDIPEPQRVPFFLVVDEFQNFDQSPFKTFFTETGKFKTYLTLSHQELTQTADGLIASVMGAVEVAYSFRVNVDDAPRIQRYISGPRSMYRVQYSDEWKPISKFVTGAQKILSEHIAEGKKYLKEYKYDQPLPDAKEVGEVKRNMAEGYNKDLRAKFYDPTARRVAEMEKDLATLQKKKLGPEALKEIALREYGRNGKWRDWFDNLREDKGTRLFPNIEFRELLYPSTQELSELQRYTVFCKIKGKRKPDLISTNPLPNPDEATRQQILKAHEQRAIERKQRRQSTEEKKSQEQQEERQQQKSYETDKDFFN